ncbi:homoserine dehydrogenase [candidate division WOR-3 bacterium]|nr:homoserine dehydrogenase [candidate division WOR-3 bacterium]
MKYKIAIIGFGTVGQGFAEILEEKGVWLKERYGLDFDVVAISDPVKGSVYADPSRHGTGREHGLDLKKILSLIKETGKIDSYSEGIKGWDSVRTITDTNSNVIAEASPTNIETGEPGITHIRSALNNKKHVITTNKGPVALAYRELAKLASENEVFFRFEGTVISGTPALNLGLEALAGIKIQEIRGILNGTTNYILTEMESGKTYEEVLREAQRLGYAEAKPDADVEGWDALAKVLILANVVMGGNLRVQDIERTGITGITLQDIQEAKSENKRYKLIGKVRKENGGIKASVRPEKLNIGDSLAQVNGVLNALTFVTDELREVTIVGPGAGRRETGFSLLSDLLNIHQLLEKSSSTIDPSRIVTC